MRIKCPSLEEQERYLTGLGFEAAVIPYNSDSRGMWGI